MKPWSQNGSLISIERIDTQMKDEGIKCTYMNKMQTFAFISLSSLGRETMHSFELILKLILIPPTPKLASTHMESNGKGMGSSVPWDQLLITSDTGDICEPSLTLESLGTESQRKERLEHT